ncbi:MAG: DUF4968 domain-containing protein, partial [Balneolales bacterium]|nr:DUF4968 domain-containing protein [Balneolales bacterium]
MKKLCLLFPILVLVACSNPANREFVDFSYENNRYEIEVDDGEYLIRFYTPEIVETSFIPTGESFVEESHAVVLNPSGNLDVRVDESEREINLVSEGITVNIR